MITQSNWYNLSSLRSCYQILSFPSDEDYHISRQQEDIHILYLDQSGELRRSVKLLIGGLFYRFIDLDKVEIENSEEDNQYVLKVASSEPKLGYNSIDLNRLTLLEDYKQLIKYNY